MWYTKVSAKPLAVSFANAFWRQTENFWICLMILFRAVSRIEIQPFFSLIPYFGCWGLCLGMKLPGNLHKGLPLELFQRSAVNSLVGSQPSLIKHVTVLHSDFFWAYPFLKLLSGCELFIIWSNRLSSLLLHESWAEFYSKKDSCGSFISLRTPLTFIHRV